MGLEEWFVESYLDRRLPLPGPSVQFLLNHYLAFNHRLEALRGRTSFVPGGEDEIATRAQELMETHYNMPLGLFRNFLGRTMKYSMGLWEKGARDVDEAQEHMMADLSDKADVRDGQRILDIGCGFGSYAEHALRRYPEARVYGLTLSQVQADYMRAKQAEPGHPLNTDRFYLIQDDFNNITFDQPFDRIISIGVFEHVSGLSKALEKVRSFMRDDGVCFLHYIVYRPRPGQPDTARQDPFIDRYIFPGGRIWSDKELFKHQEHFRIEQSWYLNGRNYQRTLEGWLANFLANRERIKAESELDERKLRLWEFYLRSCIASFRVRGGEHLGNGQYRLIPA